MTSSGPLGDGKGDHCIGRQWSTRRSEHFVVAPIRGSIEENISGHITTWLNEILLAQQTQSLAPQVQAAYSTPTRLPRRVRVRRRPEQENEESKDLVKLDRETLATTMAPLLTSWSIQCRKGVF